MTDVATLAPDAASVLCQSCGACCGYSAEWPRFSLETDAELDLIPARLVNLSLSGMACEADRCRALSGVIGSHVACTIYAVRPQVCRACMPGDDACNMARRRFRLYELPRAAAYAPGADFLDQTEIKRDFE